MSEIQTLVMCCLWMNIIITQYMDSAANTHTQYCAKALKHM